ncbi:MAG: hypothetical protein LBF93_06610 [Zoogloeaceae bacterium]|jgi:hypothetical protein|nr:hypothetical protein [Zoogloeaceae bacterium]
MHLIDGAGHVDNNFVAEDILAARPPTEITADFMNAVQHELANFILWSGRTLDKQDNTQLREALIHSFAHKNSTIHYIRQIWTIVEDTDALLALEGVPSNSDVIVTNWNGTHGLATWNGATWTTTPLAVDVFDLYGADVDQHGYYWFSNQWNLFDVAALQVDEASEQASGIARLATLAEALAGASTNLIITPATLAAFSRALLPAGTEIAWTGTTPPAGFLEENGALVSRAAYPDLWAHAQASGNLVTDEEWGDDSWGAFSTGNGTTTFRLPDARGEFIRGWDDGRGVDTGRAFVKWQKPTPASGHHDSIGVPKLENASDVTDYTPLGFTTNKANVTSNGSSGHRVRPRNIARMLCVKY